MHIDDGHRGLSISRRSFLRSGTLTAALVPAISSWELPAAAAIPAERSFAPNAGLLETAKSTAQWIQGAQKQDERGIWWLPDPDHPEKLTTVSAPNTVYSGTAGTVLFFIQLAQATGNSEYLATAAKGADYLAATWRDLVDKPGVGLLSGPGLNLSLYLSTTACRAWPLR
jgi:lantibiotic modifying enzyme